MAVPFWADMSRAASPPSAHDVARLAGVSQAAVSRAFTQGASISDGMRARVIEASRQLGYRPNLLARSLITGKSGIVGVVIGSPRNPFFLEALDFLSARLSQEQRQLQVFTARAESDVDAMVEALLRFRVDALLLMSANVSPGLARQCRAACIPVVCFNRRARVIDGFPCITGANRNGGARIAAHLSEQGYRQFAFLAGTRHSPTSRERLAGFTGKLAELGLAPPRLVHGDYDTAVAADAVRALLASPDPPDAIFCASDMMALAAIEVARYDFGLAVGPDVGIAGFDDVEGASWRSFDLTTYSQPTDLMVDAAVRFLLKPLPSDRAMHVEVDGELKIRASTRRLPAPGPIEGD